VNCVVNTDQRRHTSEVIHHLIEASD